MHREMLRLARVLALDEGGKPRWVSRNRAVSNAYYALFHALAELCARQLVGAWRPWLPFVHVYRSLEHGQARRVLDAASVRPLRARTSRRSPNSSSSCRTSVIAPIIT